MSNNLVCIDSMICIWGIKKESLPEQQHMIRKAEFFLSWLDDMGKKILIPSPVITEILTPINDIEKRNLVMNIIDKNFIVGNYDAPAAIKGGEIAHKRNDWREIYTEGDENLKNRFKFDTMILAIAITKKVETLYTEDKRLQIIAKEYLNVQSMPDIPFQLKLDIPDGEK
jgi:predicted nucleic acid-binding protein